MLLRHVELCSRTYCPWVGRTFEKAGEPGDAQSTVHPYRGSDSERVDVEPRNQDTL